MASDNPFVESGNPFADPIDMQGQRNSLSDSTLAVGKNASLTLATDSLVVVDERFAKNDEVDCCGLLQRKSKTSQAIPFFNVLWAQVSEDDVTVHYARQVSKEIVRVAHVRYEVDKPLLPVAKSWVERLLDRAYGTAQRKKRIKLLINPFGGKGNAQKMYVQDIEPIFAAAKCELDVEKTRYRGHAVEIAETLDVDQYDVVASCSGDGLPYEVFNGLGKRPDAAGALSKIAVVQLPCGSGNAMSLNLNGTSSCSLAALSIVKGLPTPLDLVSITQGDRRTLSFLSQSVGIVAEVDLGTDNLRWMGPARFTYGFLVRLLTKKIYPCDLAVKVEIPDKEGIKQHYREAVADKSPVNTEFGSASSSEGLPPLKYGTVQDELPPDWKLVPYDTLGNFWAGNMAYMAPDMSFFPASLPSDGCMDLVTVDGRIGRASSIKSFIAVESGDHFDMPHVNLRKVTGYRIIPKNQTDGYISIDGERVPFEPFQAEVHKGLGMVLSRSGRRYEAKGPKGV